MKNTIGIYGKLPAHGDFIQRNLPSPLITEWDQWLQHFIGGSKEHIGETWLDIYLTSPVWRFVLSDGIVDEHKWAGILLPSVDRVGRYFPLTIIMQLPQSSNPLEFIALQHGWYSGIEKQALIALDEELTVDDLSEMLSELDVNIDSQYVPSGINIESYAMHMELEFEEQSVVSIYPHMLDTLMMKVLNSYSIWNTMGSEHVAPGIFSVQGLPSVNKLPSMLDGKWQQRGWSEPYTLRID
jgi:type VI secretion system protein ImpM